MAKGKSLTPQEIYRAKKQKEEEEKLAYLPPGLINHGNTCFMNSVLQGLIATTLLCDLVNFNPISEDVQMHSAALLASRRSPQLTNGHELGGSFEQKWVNTMPIGDALVGVLYKAWDLQIRRQRESLSPKIILTTLGRKYEQYLDFAQQDAHEFMRILLDAMRMEELDVIKKRQPPPPPEKSKKKRRRMTLTPASYDASNADDKPTDIEIPENERLMSMVDMIFGGKLTSFLVCQKCKHVSQTFEDFNDLSLSIKAEDYAKERKRDRLKNLAKKLTTFSSSTSSTNVASTSSTSHRASSVPPPTSPREREIPPLGDLPDVGDEPRRKSLDLPEQNHIAPEVDESAPPSGTEGGDSPPTPEEKKVNFIDPGKEEKKRKKMQATDQWVKLGRRISMTVGIGKGSKDERIGRSRDRKSEELSVKNDAPVSNTLDSTHSTPRASLSSEQPQQTRSIDLPTSHSFEFIDHPSRPTPRPKSLQLPQHSSSPLITTVQRLQRSKSPKAPKPSKAETEYLRRLLADIPPSSASPFGFLKPSNVPSGSVPSTPSSTNWLKPTGHLQSVEECLRMFTSVEILDKENVVGCRTCWKIANGILKVQPQQNGDDDDEDEDEEEEDNDEDKRNELEILPLRPVSQSAPATPSRDETLPISISSPSISVYRSDTNISTNSSVTSLPSTMTSVSESALSEPPNYFNGHRNKLKLPTPGGIPIPLISTTSPEGIRSDNDPVPETAKLNGVFFQSKSKALESELADAMTDDHQSFTAPPLVSTSTDTTVVPSSDTPFRDTPPSEPKTSFATLKAIPPHIHGRHVPDKDLTDDSSDGESDASTAATSATGADGDASANELSDTRVSPVSAAKKPKPKKPKPVIMNPAYKRYLIATPPPILVIHLKRFQQIAKSSLMSFSSGFKKLEDNIVFPEYLDLAPFLAPKKEDYGLGKPLKQVVNGIKQKDKGREECMYRLYAVVVHIGSMLGGHYVAYVALPTPTPPSEDHASRPSSPSHEPNNSNGPTPPERQWAYVSDTVVRLTTKEEVLKAKAYICMYERT